jgi:hypothetical protein
MRSFLFEAKDWRSRGDEVRARAEQTNDPLARQAMLRIAAEYEKLAQRVEAHDASGDDPVVCAGLPA